jgi:ankyrin repeat protein
MDLIKLHWSETATLDQIKRLVSIKGDINYGNKWKETPLMWLCKNELVTLEMIRHMIENKADVNNVSIYKETPMMWLCENKSVTLDLIRYMVENGADVNYKNRYNDRPLMLICRNRWIEIEEKLDIINFMKKYVTDIDIEIEKINNSRCIENKGKIIEELERVESRTKSAAKR